MESVNEKDDENEGRRKPVVVKSFNDVLEKIGYFGWFQILLLTLVALRGYIHGSQNMCPVFTMYIPEHRYVFGSVFQT